MYVSAVWTDVRESGALPCPSSPESLIAVEERGDLRVARRKLKAGVVQVVKQGTP